MATRFDGKVFKFTQPDGSKIDLRGFGDQNFAFFETLDGYTVTKNPASGYWEIARVFPDGSALEPASSPRGRLDGAAASVPRALRISREAAVARGRESALHVGGRRCDQRREERRQQLRALRLAA